MTVIGAFGSLYALNINWLTILLSSCDGSCDGLDAAPRRGRRSSVRQDGQGIGSAYPNHEEPATRQPPSTAPYPSIRAGRALRRHDTIPGGRHPYAPSAPNGHVVSGPSRRSHQYPASVSQDVQAVHLIPANVTYDPIPVLPALRSASPSRGISPWHGATPQSSGALYDPGFTTAHLPPLSAYGPTTGLPYIPEFTYGPGGEYQSQMGAFLDPVAQYALDQELALGRFENLTPEPPAPISWNGHPMSQQAVPSLNLSYGAEYLTVGPFQGIQPIPTHQDLWPTMLGGMVAVHSQPNLPWPSPDTGYFGPSFSDDPDF